MHSIIGPNQTVSPMVYTMAICNQTRLPHDFIASQSKRITLAYTMGESIQMISDELMLRYRLRALARTKTPRELATRVVRI